MNNNQSKHKRYLGEQFQVGLLKKVRDHQFKARVVLRFFPKQFSKDKVERILYEGKVDMRNIKSEELFEFEGCKYGVIYTIDIETGEQIDNVLTKYFYERKISQPEVQVIGDNVRISNTLKNSYKSFYQPQKNSFDQLQQLVCEKNGVQNIENCKGNILYQIFLQSMSHRLLRKQDKKAQVKRVQSFLYILLFFFNKKTL